MKSRTVYLNCAAAEIIPSFIQVLSKMAQFIRYPYDRNDNLIGYVDYIRQVCQVSYRNQYSIEIFFDENLHRAIIDDNGQIFWLACIDIPCPTIRQILVYLGHEHEQMIATWSEDDNVDAVLNRAVDVDIVSTVTLYAPNQPIPLVHYQGPLPAPLALYVH